MADEINMELASETTDIYTDLAVKAALSLREKNPEIVGQGEFTLDGEKVYLVVTSSSVSLGEQDDYILMHNIVATEGLEVVFATKSSPIGEQFCKP